MAIVLGAIADDYTGASDLANTLAKNGLATVQTIGVPSADLVLPEVDAVVVSLKIRSAPAVEAVAAARAADKWMRARGAAHVMYKICSTFDSTDAGNIGPVTEALRADHREHIAIVTPAFPETGRTVYRGHLFVGDVPLNESPLKDHPLNPMHDSNLVRVLAAQSKGKVGLLPLDAIAQGAVAAAERLAALEKDGVASCIADAVFERDLEILGEIAFAAPVSTGASGLGLGLARAAVRARRTRAATSAADAKAKVGGLAAAVAGSCSQATLQQIARAERVMPVLRLDTSRLLSSDAEAELAAAVGWAAERVGKGPVLIASSAPPEEVARLQAQHGREHAGAAIEQATARIAAALVDRGVRRLVVAGGETSGATVDRLGVPAFLVEEEIAAGVPILRTAGWKGPEMRLALKSGNFGGQDFFEKAFAMMG
ncbi:MAG: 3-oxo-tetronate kinase [Beijerinckiaceae bacterium]